MTAHTDAQVLVAQVDHPNGHSTFDLTEADLTALLQTLAEPDRVLSFPHHGTGEVLYVPARVVTGVRVYRCSTACQEALG